MQPTCSLVQDEHSQDSPQSSLWTLLTEQSLSFTEEVSCRNSIICLSVCLLYMSRWLLLSLLPSPSFPPHIFLPFEQHRLSCMQLLTLSLSSVSNYHPPPLSSCPPLFLLLLVLPVMHHAASWERALFAS